MSQTVPISKEAVIKPPTISYKTLKNFLETFKTSEIPSHIDRSVMPPSMSGGNQVYVVSALKFLGLISDNGVPQDNFTKVVKSEGEARAALLREALTAAYAFLLKDLDIERATTKVVMERFKDTGITGDTIRKAIVFFQAATKDAGMKVSPHIKPYMGTRANRPTKPRGKATSEDEEQGDTDELTDDNTFNSRKSETNPYQVLIDILSPDMEEDEQQAVWTLIRYLKKQDTIPE